MNLLSIDNEFLRNWVQISTWQTLLFLGLAVAGMIFAWKVGSKTKSFTKMIFAGVAAAIFIGVVGGFMTDWDYSHHYELATSNDEYIKEISWTGETGFEYSHYWVKEVFGTWYGAAWMWIRVLQMLITPTIFFAIIALIIKFGKDKKTSSAFVKSTAILVIATGIAAVIGILVGLMFWEPLKDLPFGAPADKGTSTDSTLYGLIYSFFPNNLFSMFSSANSLIIPVILFAVVIGGFTLKMKGWGGDYKKSADSIESGINTMDRLFKTILDYLIGLLPLVIVLLLSRAITRNINTSSFASIGMYLVAIYVALAIVYVLQVLFASTMAKTSPLRFIKNTWNATFTGFTTQSSLGTLPVTIKTMKKAGVSEANSEIAPTLATTLGAQGCAGVFPALVVVVLAAGGQIDLSASLLIQTVVIIMFASLGIAGVPGVAGVAVAIVLGGIGESDSYAYYAAILLPLGSLIDMGRTAVNVNGGMMAAVTIDAMSDTLDRKTWEAGASDATTATPVVKPTAKKATTKTAAKKAPAKK